MLRHPLSLLISSTLVLITGCGTDFVDALGSGRQSLKNGVVPQYVDFEQQVLPLFSKQLLSGKCTDCHSGATPIASLQLDISQSTAQEIYDGLKLGRINLSAPDESPLLTRPLGLNHVQAFADVSDPDFQMLRDWIVEGAMFEPPVLPPSGEPTPTPSVTPTPTATPTATPPAQMSFFQVNIHAKLGSCVGCHSAAPRMILAGNDPVIVCNNIKNFANGITANNPTAGLFYTKPVANTGVNHAGGKLWLANGDEQQAIIDWAMMKNLSCTDP